MPPATLPPHHYVEEHVFDRLGVRVPAILISPYVERGVLNTQLDHSSLR